MISTTRDSSRLQFACSNAYNPTKFAASPDAGIILLTAGEDVWEPHHQCYPEETVGGHMVRKWLSDLRRKFNA
ncbi:MAG TPA: hypothetical protein V6C52_06650 [Coleofasciculaceae cyanobacterium]|jgi:hypothetical protein